MENNTANQKQIYSTINDHRRVIIPDMTLLLKEYDIPKVIAGNITKKVESGRILHNNK